MQIKDFFKKIKNKYFSNEACIELKQDKRFDSAVLANWFIALALIGGIIIILLSPPFTCPDENCHYLNICRIVEGNFFPDVKDNFVGSYITADQNAFLNGFYGKYDGINSPKFDFWEAYFQSYLEFNNEEEVFYPTTLSTINPVSYIIPAIGAWIAKNIFSMESPYVMLMFAKLFNLIFYIVLTAIAIKKTPIFKKTMLLVALMPMTLYQCASASYDAMLIPSAFLFFAYVMKILLSEDDYQIQLEDIIMICFSCIGLFVVKIAYAPLVLILLSIPFKKFGATKKYVNCILSVASVAIIFYLIPTVVCNAISSGCIDGTQEIINKQKEYFLSNIFVVFPVLKNTISNSIGFWCNSFFGILGNLDTNFPPMLITIYYLLLVFVVATEICSAKGVNIRARALSAASCLVFFVGTVVAMYISWTPLVTNTIGGDSSTGFQGRYFIPVALFALIIFANSCLSKFKYREKLNSFCISAVKMSTLCYVALTCLIMLLRFWI